MNYQICYTSWKNTFSVPCGVVDDQLFRCSGVELKILLYILRDQSAPIDPEALSKLFSLPCADVRDALNHWAREGLLQLSDLDSAPSVPPVPLKQEENPAERSASHASASAPKPMPTRMTASEIHELTQRQPIIRSLLHEAEGLLGKTLTSTDISTIISLYDWAGIPADVILMVIAYCASRDKRNLRYIEKTALSWMEMGLDNNEAIEKYLDAQSEVKSREQEIKNAFGIHDRQFTSNEKKYIDQWYNEFHFGINMIRLAYEKAVDNTGKVAFPYIHKVLSNWKEKGYTTPEQALSEASPKSKSCAKTEYSFNLDEFEELHRRHVPTID